MNLFLYVSAALIWGSNWLAMKLQWTQVPPSLSVVYRFCLAALILPAYRRLTRTRLNYSLRDHSFITGVKLGSCLRLTFLCLSYYVVQSFEENQ